MSITSKENNFALNFIKSGKGETSLVFLHYFGGSSHTWSPVIDELNGDFHCIAIDLPGFGASDSFTDELSVNDTTEIVAGVIDSLQLEQYVLIGHSMGGKIALSLAARKPLGLKRVVLFAPSPPTPEPMSDEEREQLLSAYNNRAALINNINNITSRQLSDFDINNLVTDNLRASESAWKAWVQHGSQEDISLQMSNVNIPVVVVNGRDDKKFTNEFLRNEFVKYFQKVHFKEIAESGHLLPVETPLAVAKLIRETIITSPF